MTKAATQEFRSLLKRFIKETKDNGETLQAALTLMRVAPRSTERLLLEKYEKEFKGWIKLIE